MRRTWLPVIIPFLLLSGCGGGSSSVDPSQPNVIFSVDLTSNFSDVKTFNGGKRQAGWVRFTGPTVVNGVNAEVTALSAVNYTSGSGPLSGYMTLTFPDTTFVTMKMDGSAQYNDVTKVSTFKADLVVLGGTGTYENATGKGTMTGRRETGLGGPVELDIKASIH